MIEYQYLKNINLYKRQKKIRPDMDPGFLQYRIRVNSIRIRDTGLIQGEHQWIPRGDKSLIAPRVLHPTGYVLYV